MLNMKTVTKSTDQHTVPQVIGFPITNTNVAAGENEIQHGIFRLVSFFTLLFVLSLLNWDYIFDS